MILSGERQTNDVKNKELLKQQFFYERERMESLVLGTQTIYCHKHEDTIWVQMSIWYWKSVEVHCTALAKSEKGYLRMDKTYWRFKETAENVR